MDESELISLLSDQRAAPVFVCRVDPRVASAINAHTRSVYLSRVTVQKQEAKHRMKSVNLYMMAPLIIERGWVRIEHPRHAIFIYHEKHGTKTRSYKAAVKATRDGGELYLASVHRVRRTDVRAVYTKTVSLLEHERGKRREVGPPTNPT